MKVQSLLAAIAVAGLGACDVIPKSTYSMTAASMLPTLHEGDIVGADGWKGDCGRAKPTAGQVVIYRRDKQSFIARAVAAPGQTVELTGGRLLVDGRTVTTSPAGSHDIEMFGTVRSAPVLRETLANGASYLTLDLGPDSELDNIAPTRVTGWYLLGDNRDNAADSRVYGPVAEADICAVATAILAAKDVSRVGRRP
ncbi:signal peptidase I [Phenylobacterium sp.]|uniref:signal peptidase I n=1 Tax=Phenylobacterium sp. TaxID=1871053 RepID=UPI00301C1803